MASMGASGAAPLRSAPEEFVSRITRAFTTAATSTDTGTGTGASTTAALAISLPLPLRNCIDVPPIHIFVNQPEWLMKFLEVIITQEAAAPSEAVFDTLLELYLREDVRCRSEQCTCTSRPKESTGLCRV
jgi:hypothetical protein